MIAFFIYFSYIKLLFINCNEKNKQSAFCKIKIKYFLQNKKEIFLAKEKTNLFLQQKANNFSCIRKKKLVL